MIKIAERIWIYEEREVKVCAKVDVGRKVEHKKPCIPANSQ